MPNNEPRPQADYNAWLARQHGPAHARRTAATHASFFLPLLKPGMRLLDIGCGPGSITAGLAETVAPGLTIGLDRDVSRIRGGPRQFSSVAGDGFFLPFRDGAFDAVFIHFVLQHVAEPSRIVAEANRVLDSGGMIGVADADFAGSIIGPASPELDDALALMVRLRQEHGGSPYVGRELGSLLRAAGFADVDHGARAEVESGAAAERTGTGQARHFGAAELRARGVATEAELDAAVAAWERWSATPGAFWARFTCFATGRKP